MTQEEKKKFRATSTWKKWTKHIKELHNYTCDCCGLRKKKGLITHHADEEHYDLLIEENFYLLCHQCHETVTRLQTIKHRENYNPQWVAFYARFLCNSDSSTNYTSEDK